MLKYFLKIFSPLGVDKLCLLFPMSMSGTISEKKTFNDKCCTPLLTDTEKHMGQSLKVQYP